MTPNLFDYLFSYRPTFDRNPKEDFFTAMIGFLFDFDRRLASQWITHISEGRLNPNPQELKILTQYSIAEYGRPDLAFLWTENGIKKSLLAEHKIDSPIGDRERDESGETRNQVDNYLRYQRIVGDPIDHKVAVFKVSPIPFLTERHNSSPYFLGEFTWEKFYKFINKYNRTLSKRIDNQTTNFLSDQISTFMRRWNMVFDNFTIQELASLYPYSDFTKKSIRLAEMVINGFKARSEDIKEILGFSSDAWGANNVGNNWGLILHNKKKAKDSTIWVHIGFSMFAEEDEWFPATSMSKQQIPGLG